MVKTARPDMLMALVVSLGLLTMAVWWWQQRVVHTRPAEIKDEAWVRVKEAYPLPAELTASTFASTGSVEAIIRTNPFSSKRRTVASPSGGAQDDGMGGGASEPPPKPQFIYKGRINVGSHQRAIVEDTTSHKTYFLEVGQEVAGFKVLDIAENRVLLSDLKTHNDVVVAISSTSRQ